MIFTLKRVLFLQNILLADEINRAPAKVQSALLEAMAERQVTIGDKTYPLDVPFLVLATQNPIEQEGTYPLPEAQMDRFLFKVLIDYPSKEEELQILEMTHKGKPMDLKPLLHKEDVDRMSEIVSEIHVDQNIKNFAVDLVSATRNPSQYGLSSIEQFLQMGVSPRATIALIRGAKAVAFLNSRSYVTAEDVKSIVFPVFRHRFLLTYEAEAEEMQADDIIKQIVASVSIG